MRYILNILLTFVLCFNITTYALCITYTESNKFQLIDGLPDNGVTALLQDSRGYVWVATYGGLTRYNGHSLTSFVNTMDNKLFRSNRLRSLYEDSNNDIWIGTDIGVTIYDRTTAEFYNLEHNSVMDREAECIVRKIFPSQDGSLIYCLTEHSGILVYDNKKELKLHLSLDREALFQDAVHIDNERYILASNRGLLLYDFDSGKFEDIFVSKQNDENSSATIIKIDETTILYGSVDGIREIKYTIADGSLEVIIPKTNLYSHRSIKSLMIDEDGTLWVGTLRDGLHFLEDAKNRLGEPLTRLSSNRRISTIINSTSGKKWVGSFDDGLHSYDALNSVFKTLDTEKIATKTTWTISALAYDDNQILYQHDYNSLSLFDLRDGKPKPLPFNITDKERNAFRYIIRRSNGDFWLFMQNDDKCWRVVVKEGSNKIVRIDEPQLKDFKFTTPYYLVEDCWGDLWVGTSYSLYRLSISDNQITKVEQITQHTSFVDGELTKIRSIYSDQYSNSLWVASETSGLMRFNMERRVAMDQIKVSQYKERGSGSITSNFVTSIVRTPDNILYVGTEQGGICRVDESSEELKFHPYVVESGLANNNIKSIVCDKNGKLWMSTSYGLSQYNPKDSTFTTYHKEQGLPFDKFLYIGTSIGDRVVMSNNRNLCYFNPSELKSSAPIPNVEFTNLKLFNEIIAPQKIYNGRVIIERVPHDGDVIELKPVENMFSIGVDVLYNDISHGNELKYRLLPLSEEWLSQPYNTQEITFRGLKYGNYVLEVTASNHYGEFATPKTLKFHIATPYWLRWWAFVIYFVIIVLTMLFIAHNQNLRHQLHIESIKKRNLEKMNADKLHYFSNISHELKTPLTLIMAPVSMLTERFSLDSDVSSKLNIVKRQSEKMLRLIELANNIELNDLNMLKRNNTKFSFNDFVLNMLPDFKFKANFDSKSLTVDSYASNIIVEADSSLIEKLIYNLLSNAFKHTRNGDQITLRYSVLSDNRLHIEVEDSGYGIAPEDIGHIFERFYRAKDRAKRNIGGTGIGLYFSKSIVELHNGEIDVKSVLNQGSKFTVSLPIVSDVVEVENPQSSVAESSIEPLTLSELSPEIYNQESEFKNSLVYIVEDNPEMRQLIISITSKLYCVKSFANGVECCEALKGEWPDIIISDVMMPEMDGYELCEKVKGDLKTSHIPIILLTACTTIDDKLKGLKYGADSYIPKPFYPDHVITRIEMLLSGRKHLRERFQINMPIVYGSNNSIRARDNDFLENLYEVFSKHLSDEELDTDVMAEELGIGRSQFFQKVKAITNGSPYELLREYRLQRAAEFLQQEDANVNEACMMTGFKNRSHFSKVFKDRFGMSPSLYAKQIKDGEA